MFEIFPFKTITSPALIKIFDEILVNALDNAFRDSIERTIRVAINPVTGQILILNDGKGIADTKIYEKYTIDVIFGQFMSGSNLSEKKSFVGGRNGVGAAVTNAFSQVFAVQSACPASQTLYKQTWSSNMQHVGEPAIKKFSGKNGYVSVSFVPDYERFNLPVPSPEAPLDPGVIDALCSRVLEVAICSNLLNRKFNLHFFVGECDFSATGKIPWALVPCKTSSGLLSKMVTATPKRTIATDSIVDPKTGLSILDLAVTCVGPDETEYLDAHCSRVMAYVNGVKCLSGTHVKHIERQLVEMVRSKVLAKVKKNETINVKPQQVLSRLAIVATCLVADKKFTSQTKETLSTNNLGFSWAPSKKFENALCVRTTIVADVLNAAISKQTASNQKSGSARSKTVRIEKYDAPANRKGSKIKPTLLVVEGDSAKSFAVAGLSQIGRENHGIMPLRGKLINVRANTDLKNSSNKEISDLCNILNLQPGKKYTREEVDKLPFGSVTILTDQDSDGVHILGLILNWLHYSFPTLLQAKPDFCKRFFTPLVKVVLTDKSEQKFFSLKTFRDWQSLQTADVVRKSAMQFYKGLGTSTSAEARECFKNEGKHTMTLRYTGGPCDESMSMYFDAKRAADRKTLIGDEYDEEVQIDFSQKSVSFGDIVHKDLVHFARYDTERSLPSLIDGFKLVLRKVSYYSFNKLNSRTKVAQLGAAAACFSQYHHGEVSICEAAVGLAQEHTGTNNVALLLPEGQFGSRSDRPCKHAAVRYLHSNIQPIATRIFRPEDTPLLKNLVDEGKIIEPEYYVPIVPFVLINGSSGIGTGFSTYIPPCNPKDVIAASEAFARGYALPQITPWFDGFKGQIHVTGERFITSSVFTFDPQLHLLTITELPIGTWTDIYLDTVKKSMMEGSDPLVKDVFNGSTEHHVQIELRVSDRVNAMSREDIVKAFKLETGFALTNMYGFDHNKMLVKITELSDIVKMHGAVRIDLYRKRLDYEIQQMRDKIAVDEQLTRFISMVVADELKIFRRQTDAVVLDLKTAGFSTHRAGKPEGTKHFDHLLSVPISHFTQDKIDDLATKLARMELLLAELLQTTPAQLWLKELDDLKETYSLYQIAKAERHGSCNVTRKRKRQIYRRQIKKAEA